MCDEDSGANRWILMTRYFTRYSLYSVLSRFLVMEGSAYEAGDWIEIRICLQRGAGDGGAGCLCAASRAGWGWDGASGGRVGFGRLDRLQTGDGAGSFSGSDRTVSGADQEHAGGKKIGTGFFADGFEGRQRSVIAQRGCVVGRSGGGSGCESKILADVFCRAEVVAEKRYEEAGKSEFGNYERE